MADNIALATGSGGATLAADELVISGATVLVQRVKVGFGADGSYSETATGTPYPIMIEDQRAPLEFVNAGTATIPIEVTQWTATGAVNVATTATQPVTVQNTATVAVSGIVSIDSAGTATIPVSIAAAIEVGTWSATETVNVATTATQPVTVQNTATVAVSGIVSIDSAGTATIPVSIAAAIEVGTWSATETVNVATTATQPVTVTNTATAVVQQSSATELNAIVTPYKLRGQGTQVFTSVSATGRATIATGGGANTFRDMIWMTLSNNATTEAQLQIRDTSTATGMNINLAPDGGGMVFAPVSPMEQSAADGSWDVQLENAITGQVYISAKFLDVT